MASLEPSESTMISRSLWRSRPGLGRRRPDHAARHDHPQRRDVPAVRLGVEGPQDRLGEGVADDRHRVDPLVPRRCRAARRDRSGGPVIVTTLPPTIRLDSALNSPVPCISGAAGRLRGPGLVTRSVAAVEVLLRREALAVGRVEGAEQVVLAPHHALRHAGRAAGVEQHEVVAGAAPRPGARGPSVGVAAAASYGVAQSGHGPLPSSTHSHVRMRGSAGPQLVDAVGERAVEDDGDDVGVVPQVDELVGGVAVVGVDDRQPGLERAERRLQVLGRVVEVLGDLVLLGDAGGQQRWRRRRRPGGRSSAHVVVTPAWRCAIASGCRVRQRLEQVREVPASHSRGPYSRA